MGEVLLYHGRSDSVDFITQGQTRGTRWRQGGCSVVSSTGAERCHSNTCEH